MTDIQYRAITEADVPSLFEVRVRTDENRLTSEELAGLGITERTVTERLRGTLAGWLCEDRHRVVGFAMGEATTGEMWVIAVLPEYCCRGIGSALLRHIETWLASRGWIRAWLTTDLDPSLRAYSFYRKHGWRDDRIDGGVRYMVKELGKQMDGQA